MKKIINTLATLTGKKRTIIEMAIKNAQSSITPEKKKFSVVQNGGSEIIEVIRKGHGPIDTAFGKFDFYHFHLNDAWETYYCVINAIGTDKIGNPIFSTEKPLLLRIDSGCETSQRFYDRSCECREQLQKIMAQIGDQQGIIISIPGQDGRGKGIDWKLGTLELQTSLSIDTVKAARIMSEIQSKESLSPLASVDNRTYGGVIGILKYLGISEGTKISLATNNPDKKQVFVNNGYQVVDFPLIIPPTENTRIHLLAKQTFLGHKLNISDGTVSQK